MKNDNSMFLTSLNAKAGKGNSAQNVSVMKSAVINANPAFTEFEKLTKGSDVVTQYSVVGNAYENMYSRSDDIASYYSKFIYGAVPLNKQMRLKLYREMAQFPEVSDALDEICETCTSYKDENGQIIKLTFPKQCTLTDKQMKRVKEEFDEFVSLFDFESNGFEFFLNFSIDGEITWENIIDRTNPTKGIVGISSIKPECYEQILDHQGRQTGILVNVSIVPTNNPNPIDINKITGIGAISGGLQDGISTSYYQSGQAQVNDIIALPIKQITHINTGTYEQGGIIVVPILEKARRAYRQLMSIEDAIIIYRLIRAPERLVFNVDVGQASNAKAEQLLNRMKEQYNVKHMYDPSIGSVTTNYDPHQMMENFWFAKPAGSTGTEVSSIAGGQNLGQLDDLIYFQKKLYTALKVPYTRRDSTSGPIQNNDDITPEELRFAQFVMRIQNRFAKGIKETFITHLELRGIFKEFQMNPRHFNVEFTPPTNYELRQKHKLVQAKVDTYMLLADRPEMSQELIQNEFLGWSQEKIDENNRQKEKELLRKATLDYKVSKIQQTGKIEEEEPPPEPEGEPEPTPEPEGETDTGLEQSSEPSPTEEEPTETTPEKEPPAAPSIMNEPEPMAEPMAEPEEEPILEPPKE